MRKELLVDIGEKELINRLGKFMPKNQVLDDCALIKTRNHDLLVNNDSLVENIHFDLSYTPLKHLGYKAVSVNVSDICAMNGKATQITVSLAFSNRFPVEAIEELYSGIYLACKKYDY